MLIFSVIFPEKWVITMDKLDIHPFRSGMQITKTNQLYLDHAAMSPLHDNIANKIAEFHSFRQQQGADFKNWWIEIEETRKTLGKWLQADPKQIAFLWNTSAGINLAAKGLPLNEGDEIIIPDMEFPSNVYPWIHVANEKKAVVKNVYYKAHYLTAGDIINAVSERTKVISVSWVNATNGNKLDVEKLGAFCRKNDIYFVIDAIQGLGTDDLNLMNVYADFVVSGFYKWLMGPDGLSFVYISERALREMQSPWMGWAGMKDKFNYEDIVYDPAQSASRFETGNMNFSAIIGAHKGLKQLYTSREEIYERVTLLTNKLRDGLQSIPNVKVVSPHNTISGITLFTGKEKKMYDDLHISVNYRSGIRVSPHFYNTEAEIDQFLNATDS